MALYLGSDSSGNGNYFTSSGISTTAGVTYDLMVDSPTNIGDKDTGVGAEVRGNYCTLNPVAFGSQSTRTSTSNGNLSFSDATSTNTSVIGTIAPTSGKWYFELTSSNTGVYAVGLFDSITKTGSFYRNNGYYSSSFGGSGVSGYSSWTTSDVIGVAWDVDAGKIWYAKNNTWQLGSPSAGTSPTNTFTANTGLTCSIDTDNSAGTKSGDFNFGQRPFTYTAPTGFKALCTQNLTTGSTSLTSAAVQPFKHFDVSVYGGTGVAQTIVNSGFQPDLVWVKCRNVATNNVIHDSLRGSGIYRIFPDATSQESTTADGFIGLASNGFLLDGSGGGGDHNVLGRSYAGWQWKASGTAVTNTSGTITSQVSVNTTAGFSIVTYTGNGTSGATIGHGLGATASFIMLKRRDGGSGYSWYIQHPTLGPTKTIFLDSTNGAATSLGYWNNTAPTSSVFSVGNDTSLNANTGTYVAYCFAAVPGYSAFTTYTGNGSSDGPFVYCGFRPRWLLIKRYDTSGDPWWIIDSSRSPYNQTTNALRSQPTLTTEDNGANANYDFLSNGFKAKTASSQNGNETNATYIVAAFAESPFALNNRAR